MIYNQPGTTFYKAAQKIKTQAEPILAELDRLTSHTSRQSAEDSIIGDLEPPAEVLDLLVSADAIKDDIDLILNTTPLDSLCSYELPKYKPPPPPKPKRNRRADRERKRLEREAERQARLDASPGFRAVRTRRAAAAAAAFEAEAVPQESQGEVPEQQSVAPIAEEPAVEAPTTPSGKRKHKTTAAAPRQDLPPMVEEVDNQQSFKMFDQGWILPPDHRRGGRAPVERHPLPPPKKKQKIGELSFGRYHY